MIKSSLGGICCERIETDVPSWWSTAERCSVGVRTSTTVLLFCSLAAIVVSARPASAAGASPLSTSLSAVHVQRQCRAVPRRNVGGLHRRTVRRLARRPHQRSQGHTHAHRRCPPSWISKIQHLTSVTV